MEFNEMSISKIMPEYLVQKVIYEFSKRFQEDSNNDIVTNEQYCHYLLLNLSDSFNVPPHLCRKRMRQLGYDIFDGIYRDNKEQLSFIFPPGTLKEDESFVIDQFNYKTLLVKNRKFAILMESNIYIYLGNVVCFNDSKYVKKTKSPKKDEFVLTNYAREHADECLMIFKYKAANKPKKLFCFAAMTCLDYIPEYNEDKPVSFELCKANSQLDVAKIEKVEKYNNNINELNSDKLKSFANTLIYHMRNKEMGEGELALATNLSLTTIQNYCKIEKNGKKINHDPRNVMAICIGLGLERIDIYDLFKKASYDINENTMQNRAYRYIIENDLIEEGIKECNKYIRLFGQEDIPYHHKNS
jgi:hypothetical protein